MKRTSMILIFLFPVISVAQHEFQAELDVGYAFQKEIRLDNQSIEETEAFGVRFGLNYLFALNKRLFIETGLYGKYNRGQINIETLDFTFESLIAQVPLYAGYVLNDKWRFNLGAAVENNRDFDEIDFKKEHNLRYDLITKLIYSYNTTFQFSFFTNWMISNTPSFSTISSPENGLFLGVIYKLKTKDRSVK